MVGYGDDYNHLVNINADEFDILLRNCASHLSPSICGKSLSFVDWKECFPSFCESDFLFFFKYKKIVEGNLRLLVCSIIEGKKG